MWKAIYNTKLVWRLAVIEVQTCGLHGNSSIQTIKDVRHKLMDLMGISKGYKPLSMDQSRKHLLQYLPVSQAELPTRCMQDSFDDAIIPLSTDYDLQDKYVTYLGYLRLGRVTEDMDLFAVWCSMKHLYNPKHTVDQPTPYVVVTVLVDEVVFTQVTPKPDKDIRISGKVTWTGSTSMEVTVWLEQNIEGTWQRITRAVFVMVARNSTNTGPAFVNKLVPSDERETVIYKEAQERSRKRKFGKSNSLILTEPTRDEQTLIHDTFMRTVDLTDPLLGRRILPDKCVWIEDTTVNSTIFSHPEDRNFHNKVFGGFLMRQALELGWLAGYLHSKHRPSLLAISDITFKQPVNVGTILRLNSQVVYTEQNYMQVVVHAEVVDPLLRKTTTTNSFHYTFVAHDIVYGVVPQSYHESMMLIDGLRHFKEAMLISRSA